MTNSEPPMTADSTDRDTLARVIRDAVYARGFLPPLAALDAADAVLALLAAGTPPDTAPREDPGVAALLAAAEGARGWGPHVRLGCDDVADWLRGRAEEWPTHPWNPLAARPVPPGPAATRDGEAGDRG